jgi:hypothetical protein
MRIRPILGQLTVPVTSILGQLTVPVRPILGQRGGRVPPFITIPFKTLPAHRNNFWLVLPTQKARSSKGALFWFSEQPL